MKKAIIFLAAALTLTAGILDGQDQGQDILAKEFNKTRILDGQACVVYIQKNLPKRFDLDTPDTVKGSVTFILSTAPDAEKRLEHIYKKGQRDDDTLKVERKSNTVLVLEKDHDRKYAQVLAPNLLRIDETNNRYQAGSGIESGTSVPSANINLFDPGLALYYSAKFSNNITGLTVKVNQAATTGQYQLTAKFAGSNAALTVIRAILADELDDEPALLKKMSVTPLMQINAVLNAKELEEAWDALKDFNPADLD